MPPSAPAALKDGRWYRPEQVLLLVEVAASSLDYDATHWRTNVSSVNVAPVSDLLDVYLTSVPLEDDSPVTDSKPEVGSAGNLDDVRHIT